MSRYTRGPWKIEDGSYGQKIVSETERYHSGDAIATAWPDISTGDYKANARLIAAAPDMLEALEAIIEQVSWAKDEGPYAGFKHIIADAMIKATQAVTKARGE